MTVEIICGDISALPSSDHATELLPLTDGDTLTLSCTDSDLKAAYRVLRAIMDYGYEHAQPSRVRLICADEALQTIVRSRQELRGRFGETKQELAERYETILQKVDRYL